MLAFQQPAWGGRLIHGLLGEMMIEDVTTTSVPLAAPPAEAPPKAAPPDSENAATDDPVDPFFLRRLLRDGSSFLVSAVVHMALLIGLSLLTVNNERVPDVIQIVEAQMAEEPPKLEDVQAIELENQLTDVQERNNAVFSSSLVVMGEVGAAGPRGALTAPTIDKAITEQMAPSEEVVAPGMFFETPAMKELIVAAPDGLLGDARAVVDSYQEALDQITQEILWMLDKGKVLVVWNFDQSESMKNDQKEIRLRVEHVYKQLGLLHKTNDDSLETAITSYGERWINHTRRPSHDLTEIRSAIDSIPTDPSGKEMMCSAVAQSISVYRPYCQRTQRQMVLILITDESGERADNETVLEQAIAEAKAAKCKIYVLGREAVFGYPYAHVRWVHPQTKHVHWIPIDRGPETAFAEQLQTDGFHRRYDAHPSGFGPFECARLARETGGVFFLLPSLETDLVAGEKRKYALEAMRPYMPDLRSKLEVKQEIDKSKLRAGLEHVVYTLDPYHPEISKIIEMRVRFSPNYQQFVQEARIEQQKATIYIQYLARVEAEMKKLERHRREEGVPRWQANYDLLYAQVLAYQARMYEYGAYLEEFIKKPKMVPLTKPPNLTLVAWDITTRQKTITGDVIKPYVEQATARFHAVMRDHGGTPYSARAELELKRGYGVELIEIYDGPHPSLPPGTQLLPVPKF